MDSLISVEVLGASLTGPARPALLDVRWDLAAGARRDAYAAGHVPGAAFVDLDAELADPPGAGGRHPLPAADRFARAMRAAGVSGGRPVVVYDEGASVPAARAWWLLRYFGHERVAVLDGGLAAWVAGGEPLEPGTPAIAPGDFSPRPGQMPLLDATAAGELARRGVLIDARAAERYRGEHEPVDPAAGHIPGAVSLPVPASTQSGGRFRSPAALREAFDAAGVHDGVAVGAYCGSGVAAAQTVLALERAGYRAALYAGSWSEWITDPARPVARD